MEEKETKAIEKKKRQLKRYKKNRALIERLENKLNFLDQKITCVKSPRFTDEPRGGQPVTMGDLVADKIETEERIERLKQKGNKLKKEILEEIDTLEEVRHAEVLEAFFIDCKSMDEIADMIPCNVRTAYRLYSEGVKLLTLSSHDNDITI